MQVSSTTTNDAAAQLARTEGYLAVDPANTDLLARAIDQSLAAGEPERAARHAERALAQYPADPFFRYRQAHVMSAQQRWSEAAPLYAALLAEHADVNIAYSLANCQVWLGRHQDALDTMAPYRHDAALAGDAVTLLVRALHHTGALDQAIELALQQRARLQDHPDFLAAAALANLDQGLLDEAAAYSAAALALGTRSLEALVAKATIALVDADADAAVTAFEAIIASHPQEGRSWSGLGMASLLKRDLPQAERQLEQALKLMPRHIGTWHSLGWCKIFGGDLAGAGRAFDEALALDRNFSESHGGVAVVAALTGRPAAAREAIERALKLDRHSLAARYAQMVLSGDAADPERFSVLANKLLASHVSVRGEKLSDLVRRHAAN